jgi:hypothetical protein
MNLSPRPAEALLSQNDSRPDDLDIHQEGSRFGNTQVTGGLAFQGNFVGLTISEFVPTGVQVTNTHDVQTPRRRSDQHTQARSPTLPSSR